MQKYKEFENFIEEISNYKTLSIIGLEKNTGKTTTLNYIMKAIKNKKLAITSIGRDGEEEDVVTFTHKPRIYVKVGTLVATAKSMILRSDVTFKILEIMDIGTPLGNIVIAESATSGFVEVAGPSIKEQIKGVINKLNKHGAEFTIVDGALSRKSLAAPAVAEAVVLCVGAAFSHSIFKIAYETENLASLFSVGKADFKIVRLYEKLMKEARVAFVYEDHVEKSEASTSIDSYKEIISSYRDDLKYVFIKGIVTDKFMRKILDSNFKVKKAAFIVEDGTKIFIKKDTYDRFVLKGGTIKVVDSIKLAGISVNPWSPEGIVLDYEELYSELKSKIQIPIFNVKQFDMDVIE
ncbi:hypothetical protein ACJDT4_20470 [Clostridium neuense]|uniref:Uncharacterized protein n=1 Tax=Clostridium neuense TaxID=1728934 RepID=A0ABW8TMP9_9CLOT